MTTLCVRVCVGCLSAIPVGLTAAKCPVTFAPASTLTGLLYPDSVAIGDVNRDGFPDIVVKSASGTESHTLAVFRGSGGGTFSSPLRYGDAGGAASYFTLEDLDGDGDLDYFAVSLATGTNDPSGTSRLRNDGNGNFVFWPMPVGAAPSAQGIVTARLDANNSIDAAIAARSLTVIRGVGTATPSRVDFATGIFFPLSIASGDVDGDGDIDVLLGGWDGSASNGGTLSMHRNNGAADFSNRTDRMTSHIVRDLALGDVDSDGDLDAVTTDGETVNRLYLNDGTGVFTGGISLALGQRVRDLAMADLNNDTFIDIVAANDAASTLTVLLNAQGSGFENPITLPAGTGPQSLAIGQVVGGSGLDIVTANGVWDHLTVSQFTGPLQLTSQPADFTVCATGAAVFSVASSQGAGAAYRWQRESAPNSGTYVDLANGPSGPWDGGDSGALVFGANTQGLAIVAASGSGQVLTSKHALRYRCVMTLACGSVASTSAQLTVVGASSAPCDNLDFNNDCSVFDPVDIADFLSVYSEGPCSTGACNDIDFNNDGSLFDPTDIDAFLSVFSEGPCF
jgi:hypothetical protein